jgi:hypothetical protein
LHYTIFTIQVYVERKLVKWYIWSIAFYGAEPWTVREVGQKYLGRFEMWCLKRMEKISWTDQVRCEETLRRIKEERNTVHTTKRRKANWIGHILRRNCLLSHVIEGKILEVKTKKKTCAPTG